MSDKLSMSEGAAVPMDASELADFLSAGPQGVSRSRPSLPPEPVDVSPPPQKPVMDVDSLKPRPQVQQEAPAPSPLRENAPDEDMKKELALPDERTRAALKQQYGAMLRVVPIPFARADGLTQTYVLRQLTRAQWRAMEDKTRNSVAGGSGEDPDGLFQENIVLLATVWPKFEEITVKAQPAGLIQTLFGVVQQMGLFFNPEALMQYTFPL